MPTKFTMLVRLIKILLVSSSVYPFSLSSCNTDHSIWKEIVTVINDSTLTTADLYNRLSKPALKRIIPEETVDSVNQVRQFFISLDKDPKVEIERKREITFIIFDKRDKIAGGPTIEVIIKSNNWFINNIRLGK